MIATNKILKKSTLSIGKVYKVYHMNLELLEIIPVEHSSVSIYRFEMGILLTDTHSIVIDLIREEIINNIIS